jgi:hypothetical protein
MAPRTVRGFFFLPSRVDDAPLDLLPFTQLFNLLI